LDDTEQFDLKFMKEDQWHPILFIHDKLPLRTLKAHPQIGSPLCPSCQHEPKNPRHFLECHHCKWEEPFETLKRELSKITQQFQLHPCIFTAIWLGLDLIHQNAPYPDIIDNILPHLIQPIWLQTQLGWEQIFHGCLSIKWASMIDEIHPNLAITGEQVLIKMTTAIWTYILAIWKVHNHHLHHTSTNFSFLNYHQAAQSLSEQRHQIPPVAQEALFRQPIDTILNLPSPQLQHWVQRGHTYFNQQLKAAKKWAAMNTLDIWSFFSAQAQQNNDLQPP